MKKTKESGFTLLELMIAVVIVAILASIAIPSYQNSVTKTRRAEGKALLLQGAAAQETNFTEYNQYAVDITTNAPPTKRALSLSSESGYYNMAISGASANGWTLTAAPQAPHVDAICGSLTLTHLGVKGITGSGTVAECWQHLKLKPNQ